MSMRRCEKRLRAAPANAYSFKVKVAGSHVLAVCLTCRMSCNDQLNLLRATSMAAPSQEKLQRTIVGEIPRPPDIAHARRYSAASGAGADAGHQPSLRIRTAGTPRRPPCACGRCCSHVSPRHRPTDSSHLGGASPCPLAPGARRPEVRGGRRQAAAQSARAGLQRGLLSARQPARPARACPDASCCRRRPCSTHASRCWS